MMDLKIGIIAKQKLLSYAARNLLGYEIDKYEKEFQLYSNNNNMNMNMNIKKMLYHEALKGLKINQRENESIALMKEILNNEINLLRSNNSDIIFSLLIIQDDACIVYMKEVFNYDKFNQINHLDFRKTTSSSDSFNWIKQTNQYDDIINAYNIKYPKLQELMDRIDLLGWFGENSANCELRSQQYRSLIGYYLTLNTSNVYTSRRESCMTRLANCLIKINSLLNINQNNNDDGDWEDCSDDVDDEDGIDCDINEINPDINSDSDYLDLSEFDINVVDKIDAETRIILISLCDKIIVYQKELMELGLIQNCETNDNIEEIIVEFNWYCDLFEILMKKSKFFQLRSYENYYNDIINNNNKNLSIEDIFINPICKLNSIYFADDNLIKRINGTITLISELSSDISIPWLNEFDIESIRINNEYSLYQYEHSIKDEINKACEIYIDKSNSFSNTFVWKFSDFELLNSSVADTFVGKSLNNIDNLYGVKRTDFRSTYRHTMKLEMQMINQTKFVKERLFILQLILNKRISSRFSISKLLEIISFCFNEGIKEFNLEDLNLCNGTLDYEFLFNFNKDNNVFDNVLINEVQKNLMKEIIWIGIVSSFTEYVDIFSISSLSLTKSSLTFEFLSLSQLCLLIGILSSCDISKSNKLANIKFILAKNEYVKPISLYDMINCVNGKILYLSKRGISYEHICKYTNLKIIFSIINLIFKFIIIYI